MAGDPGCVLACMVGLPAAGKSHFAALLRQRMAVASVDFDEVEASLAAAEGGGGGFQSDTWHRARAEAHRQIDEALAAAAGKPKAAAVRVVLADDNFYYRSMRRPLLRAARRHGAAFVQIYFEVTEATAQRRNAAREEPVPRDVLSRMALTIEPPAAGASLMDQHCLTVDAEQPLDRLPAAADEAAAFIARAAQAPQPRLPSAEEREAEGRVRRAARAQIEASVWHQIDLGTRGALGAVVRRGGLGKEQARRLNGWRRDFAQALKADPSAVADVPAIVDGETRWLALDDPRAGEESLRPAVVRGGVQAWLRFGMLRCGEGDGAIADALSAHFRDI